MLLNDFYYATIQCINMHGLLHFNTGSLAIETGYVFVFCAFAIIDKNSEKRMNSNLFSFEIFQMKLLFKIIVFIFFT